MRNGYADARFCREDYVAVRAEAFDVINAVLDFVQRLEGLEGTVPRKDIDAARTEARSLAERERSIGASLVAREALTSPVSGVIARADLVAGQVVESREASAAIGKRAAALFKSRLNATIGAP